MDDPYEIPLALLTALAIGMLIGLERGWSGREEDEGDRIAGLRTFSLIGLLAALSALLAREVGPWVLGVAFGAVAALVVAAHVLEVRQDADVGATTEFAMLLTFALAAWSTFGFELHALAVTVLVMALLGFKPTLHRWLRKVEPGELYGAIKLLVMSLVLLPFLPDRGFGPWNALNPYWVWWMVVLISGLSFVGYVSIRLAGQRAGTLITAVTGGLASSTAVTVSFAQLARKFGATNVLMGGVMIASALMFARVVIEVSVVNPGLVGSIAVPMGVMGVAMVGAATWMLRTGRGEDADARGVELRNPLQLGLALRFGLLLALILVLSEAARAWFGDRGVYLLAVISGLMDVDAITVSLSRLADENLARETAVTGIVLAAATNTLVKGALFSFHVGVRESLRLIVVVSSVAAVGVAVAFIG